MSRNSRPGNGWRLDELPRVIVPFKRDSYAKVIAAFRHLAKPVG